MFDITGTCASSEESSYLSKNKNLYRIDCIEEDLMVETFSTPESLSDDYWSASWEFSSNGDTLYIWGEGYVPNLNEWQDEYGNLCLSDSQVNALKRVEIYGDFTSVGEAAFFNYPNLQTIIIYADITKIGDYAFGSCKNLNYIKFPSTTTHIGNYAFAKTPNVKGSLSLVSGIKSIGDGAFWQSGINSVSIPGTVEHIGNGAFAECDNLEEVNIESGVPYIGDRMFLSDKSLVSVEIPDSVESIGMFAFQKCISLERINLPQSVTRIDDYAFSLCHELCSINIPENLEHLGESAFCQTGLKSITIPDTIEELKPWVFSECKSLTNVYLPNTLTSIAFCAFSKCTSLKRITLPDSLTYIGEEAFSLSGLTSVNIPGSVKDFDKEIFAGCENLLTATLKYGINKVAAGMFVSCPSLKAVSVPSSVTTIEEYAFQDCTALENIVLPNNLKIIEADAFYNCISLESIKLPDGIEEICAGAFSQSGLTEITIPDSVEFLGDEAFSECMNLEKVINCAFCPENIFEGCMMLESVELAENTSHIGGRAFCNCLSLKTLLIPETVCSISKDAFEGTDVTLQVKEGSFAHSFALENDIPYEPFGIKVIVSSDRKNFTMNTVGVPDNTLFLLALYNGKRLVEVKEPTYEGNKVTFRTDKAYTTAKIFAWENLNNQVPVCLQALVE